MKLLGLVSIKIQRHSPIHGKIQFQLTSFVDQKHNVQCTLYTHTHTTAFCATIHNRQTTTVFIIPVVLKRLLWFFNVQWSYWFICIDLLLSFTVCAIRVKSSISTRITRFNWKRIPERERERKRFKKKKSYE